MLWKRSLNRTETLEQNDIYYTVLINKLKTEIVRNRPHLRKKKVYYELWFKLIDHSPYWPDLIPRDILPFVRLMFTLQTLSNIFLVSKIMWIASEINPKFKRSPYFMLVQYTHTHFTIFNRGIFFPLARPYRYCNFFFWYL